MVKLFFLCRRRADITHERYAALLLEGHVPIALHHHPTMRRYVVNIVEQSPPGGIELDSIGELSFSTLEDFRERLYDSPEGEKIVHADVAGFMGGAVAYATTEYVQKSLLPPPTLGQRSSGVKLICPVRRREGMSHEAFVEHWLTRHVPIALEHHPQLVKYVTNVVDRKLADGGEEWDGFAELHFASRADATERMFPSAESERIVREDIARFLSRAIPYRVAEWVQKREPLQNE
jgi:uncharacterized protein (TIGR02118 family)